MMIGAWSVPVSVGSGICGACETLSGTDADVGGGAGVVLVRGDARTAVTPRAATAIAHDASRTTGLFRRARVGAVRTSRTIRGRTLHLPGLMVQLQLHNDEVVEVGSSGAVDAKAIRVIANP
jgi:hypothetical protein